MLNNSMYDNLIIGVDDMKNKDLDYYLFNAQLLKEEINILNDLHADKLLVSHYGGLLRDKSEVLEELVEIYSLRKRDDPLIRVPREG